MGSEMCIRDRSSRDRSAVVVRAAWVLKNVGPKTKDHLDEDDEVVTPGDLPLTSPRMVVGRAASESVSLEIAVPTVRCVLYTGPHTTAFAW